MQSVVAKSADALLIGRSGKPFLKIKNLSGEARCFPPYCTRDEDGARKINQCANWTNIAAGIHSRSTTALELPLFRQLTNSWLLTIDYQYSGWLPSGVLPAPYKSTVVVDTGERLFSFSTFLGRVHFLGDLRLVFACFHVLDRDVFIAVRAEDRVVWAVSTTGYRFCRLIPSRWNNLPA